MVGFSFFVELCFCVFVELWNCLVGHLASWPVGWLDKTGAFLWGAFRLFCGVDDGFMGGSGEGRYPSFPQ